MTLNNREAALRREEARMFEEAARARILKLDPELLALAKKAFEAWTEARAHANYLAWDQLVAGTKLQWVAVVDRLREEMTPDRDSYPDRESGPTFT
jgi:hypothetical protein